MKLVHIHCHTDFDEGITEWRLEYHPDLLAMYRELGIIDRDPEKMRLEDLHRLQKIARLKKNCGVNTIGASIIVDLLEKIENMQDEIEILRKKAGE